MAEGDNPVSLDVSLSPSPPTISQILSFSHNQRPQQRWLGDEATGAVGDDRAVSPQAAADNVQVSFWHPTEAGPSRELARRSDTDPGASALKRLRPTETMSDGEYRRPPPGATSTRVPASRLPGGDSYMSIVDDGEETEADDDFVPRPVVSRATSNLSTTSVAESNSETNCPICLEGWASSGAHKLASLKCGHLFGRSCIRKWLTQKTKAVGKSSCPECKQPATVRDIRVLFARSVTAADGARVEELTRENRKLAQDLGAARSEVAEYKLKSFQMQNEVLRLRGELDAVFKKSQWRDLENENLVRRVAELSNLLKGRASAADTDELSAGAGEEECPDDADLDAEAYTPCLRPRATIPVAADAGSSSRVLAFDPHCAVIYASHSLPNLHTMALIDILNPNRTPTLISPHLHSMEIRGAEVSPHADGTRYLLTASHDKTAALTALGSNGTRTAPKLAARLKLGASGWSCAWDPTDPNLCYVGMAAGSVLAFDLRHTAKPLYSWSGVKDHACLLSEQLAGGPAAPGARNAGYSQIYGIAVLPGTMHAESRLVVANSNHAYALPSKPGAPWTQLTEACDSQQRSCYSLSYDAHLGCVAASFRTKVDGAPHTTVHDLYSANVNEEGSLDWRLMQRIPTTSPQNKLARSAVFSYAPPGSKVGRRQGLFCAVLEASRSVNVWTIGGEPSETREPLALSDVSAPEDIVDVRGWQWNTPNSSEDDMPITLFASLTNSTIRLYDVR
ncbi:RING finger and WD repeat domain-containing protein 3 [Coemansia aciculifera]|uniref:RING finger and WD repeat domain-containing protein 3 n=1 Tax=Coemansia aciculifera TaxID=417176 RepID=A0A9W8M4Z7_9FUNG|nr:RING finger and WD repeat domain-containing protein 3 [Coemansia aciculifera]